MMRGVLQAKMAYRLYVTDLDVSWDEFKRQKSTYVPKIYDDLDHALDFARDALAQRLFVPLIEGDDGTRLIGYAVKRVLRKR